MLGQSYGKTHLDEDGYLLVAVVNACAALGFNQGQTLTLRGMFLSRLETFWPPSHVYWWLQNYSKIIFLLHKLKSLSLI